MLIHALPIFHVHGLFVALHGALLNGSKMIWLGQFDPKLVVDKMREATVFMGVPTLYVRMLAEAGADPRGGAPHAPVHLRLGAAAARDFQRMAGAHRPHHPGALRHERDHHADLQSLRRGDGERRGGTVGFPLPGVGLRVAATRARCSAQARSAAIEVQGPNVFKGYWRMPEKTKEEFTADGWFKTGDVGKVDERGYVTIVGRSKDLIISGGYNVYPAEIEGYINDMPGVAESALIGVPHPDFGEVGVAVVVAQARRQPGRRSRSWRS